MTTNNQSAGTSNPEKNGDSGPDHKSKTKVKMITKDGSQMHLKFSEDNDNTRVTKLPKLSSINMDMVRMTVAPPFVLDYYSKKNLEKRVHVLTFAELAFKLDKEIDPQDNNEKKSQNLQAKLC